MEEEGKIEGGAERECCGEMREEAIWDVCDEYC